MLRRAPEQWRPAVGRHLYDVYLEPFGEYNAWVSFGVGVVGLLALRNLRSAMPVPSAPVRKWLLRVWSRFFKISGGFGFVTALLRFLCNT